MKEMSRDPKEMRFCEMIRNDNAQSLFFESARVNHAMDNQRAFLNVPHEKSLEIPKKQKKIKNLQS